MRMFVVLAMLGAAFGADTRTYIEGKLLCAVYGPAAMYSHEILWQGDRRGACSFAIELDGIVYLATAYKPTRMSCPRDLVLGDPVQVSVDEKKHTIYLRNNVRLGYSKRVRSENWEGCRTLQDDARQFR